jgi:hypothetical protein
MFLSSLSSMHVNFKNSTGVPVLLPNTDIQHYDNFVNYFSLYFRHLSSEYSHNIALSLSLPQKALPDFLFLWKDSHTFPLFLAKTPIF